MDGAGNDLIEGRFQFGLATRFPVDRSIAGPSSTGLAEDLLGLKRAEGPLLQGPLEGEILKGVGDGRVGPVVGRTGSKGKEKVAEVENGPPFGPSVPLRNRLGSSLTQLMDFGV